MIANIARRGCSFPGVGLQNSQLVVAEDQQLRI
jgi:hypothetical protein